MRSVSLIFSALICLSLTTYAQESLPLETEQILSEHYPPSPGEQEWFSDQTQLADEQTQELMRLTEENQQLRQQLQQRQHTSAWFTEQQRWFALGAGCSLLSALVGAYLRGSRRKRSEWIN